MAEIHIVYAYLESLAARAESLAATLDEGSLALAAEFPGDPEVTAAYAEFADRWSRHRRDLRDAVLAAAEGFRAVLAAFEATEADLVAALDP